MVRLHRLHIPDLVNQGVRTVFPPPGFAVCSDIQTLEVFVEPLEEEPITIPEEEPIVLSDDEAIPVSDEEPLLLSWQADLANVRRSLQQRDADPVLQLGPPQFVDLCFKRLPPPWHSVVGNCFERPTITLLPSIRLGAEAYLYRQAPGKVTYWGGSYNSSVPQAPAVGPQN